MNTDLTALRGQVEALRWCKARRAEIEEIEAAAKAAVQDALGDNDTGTIDGDTVVVWKSHKRTQLDQAYLKKTFPQVHSECLITSEVRRFEVRG